MGNDFGGLAVSDSLPESEQGVANLNLQSGCSSFPLIPKQDAQIVDVCHIATCTLLMKLSDMAHNAAERHQDTLWL